MVDLLCSFNILRSKKERCLRALRVRRRMIRMKKEELARVARRVQKKPSKAWPRRFFISLSLSSFTHNLCFFIFFFHLGENWKTNKIFTPPLGTLIWWGTTIEVSCIILWILNMILINVHSYFRVNSIHIFFNHTLSFW